jgi:hypothetical protein
LTVAGGTYFHFTISVFSPSLLSFASGFSTLSGINVFCYLFVIIRVYLLFFGVLSCWKCCGRIVAAGGVLCVLVSLCTYLFIVMVRSGGVRLCEMCERYGGIFGLMFM